MQAGTGVASLQAGEFARQAYTWYAPWKASQVQVPEATARQNRHPDVSSLEAERLREERGHLQKLYQAHACRQRPHLI